MFEVFRNSLRKYRTCTCRVPITNQPTITCSEVTKETVEGHVKYVQS